MDPQHWDKDTVVQEQRGGIETGMSGIVMKVYGIDKKLFWDWNEGWGEGGIWYAFSPRDDPTG
jgi:hypothetical protein